MYQRRKIKRHMAMQHDVMVQLNNYPQRILEKKMASTKKKDAKHCNVSFFCVQNNAKRTRWFGLVSDIKRSH